jgi:sec-independent protein translocase protein TatA
MSLWHWIIVVLVVIVLFGRNVISSAMADLGKGLRELRKIGKEDVNEENN